MHRIIEAFTRPHYQVTAIDELIMVLVTITMLLVIVATAYWISSKLDP